MDTASCPGHPSLLAKTVELPGGSNDGNCGQKAVTVAKTLGKFITCKECNITMNSEEQARSHFGGKNHQNKLKELGIAVANILPNALATSQATKATFCTSCKLILNSESQAVQHYNGKSHFNRLKELGLVEGDPELVPSVDDISHLQKTETKHMGVDAVSPLRSTSFGQIPRNDQQLSSGQQTIEVKSCISQSNEAGSMKRKATSVSCDVCSLVLNSETQAAHHFASQRHIKRMKTQHKNQTQWNSVLSGEAPEMAPRRNRFYCQQCQLSVNSMSQLTAHMSGQQHLSRLQMGQHPYAISSVGQPGELCGMPANSWMEVPGNKNGWFFCRLCDISVPTALALSQHIQSAAHLECKYKSCDAGICHDGYSPLSDGWRNTQEESHYYGNSVNEWSNFVH